MSDRTSPAQDSSATMISVEGLGLGLIQGLLNATLLLAVILVGLSLVAIHKFESLTESISDNWIAKLVQAEESRIKKMMTMMSDIDQDMNLTVHYLRKIAEHPQIELNSVSQQQLAHTADRANQLIDRLNAISSEAENELQTVDYRINKVLGDLEQIDLRHNLSDRTIRSIGTAITNTLIDIRDCRPQPNEGH